MDSGGVLRLDEDQQKALQEEGRVILKASAGSGKTTTIVGLYLHLLRKGVGTHEIVAITFTEKAAAELKERIYRGVMGDEKLKEKERIVTALTHAPIGTIHSFCASILRDYPLEAGVHPDFRVFEEVESDQILTEAVRTYLDRLNSITFRGGGGEEVASFERAREAMGHSLGEVRRRVSDMVRLGRTFNRLAEDWKVVDPGSLAQAVVRLERTRDPEAAMADLLWGRGILWKAYWGGWMRRMEDLEGRAEKVDSPWRENLLEVISRLKFYISTLIRCRDGREAQERLEEMLSEISLRGFRVRMADPLREVYTDFRRSFRILRDDVRRKLLKYLQNLHLVDEELALTGDFLLLAKGAVEEFERQKGVRRALDFGDILERTYRLLKESPRVLDDLSSRIKHIIVDEYQDTDLLQMRILELFSQKGVQLYLVGDPQQSIYRFRGSEVTVFKRAPRTFSLKEMTLKRNYRSRRELIEHFNSIFSHIFPTSSRGEFEITLEPMEPAGGGVEAQGEPVEAIVAVSTRAEEAREREARKIASRVLSLLEEGYRAGEIGILFRNFTHVGVYHRALKEAGVPHVLLSGGDFYSSQVVSDVVSLIRYLLFPHDRTSLLALLRSPMVGLSDPELYRFFRMGLEALDEPRRREVEGFLKLLEELRGNLYVMPLRNIVEDALERTSYREVLALVKDGEEDLANLRKILTIIEGIELGGIMSPYEVLEQLLLRQEARTREGVAQVEVEDSSTVKLMTIHGAKGLEFPVVILADMASGGGWRAERVLYDEELGYLVPPLEADERSWRRTPLYGAMKWYIRQKELEEEKRVLYVGATRAKRKLIYSMAVKASSREEAYLEIDFARDDGTLASLLLTSLGLRYIRGSRTEELQEELQAALREAGIPESPAGEVRPPKVERPPEEVLDISEAAERVAFAPPPVSSPRATGVALSGGVGLGEVLHRTLAVWRMGEEDPREAVNRVGLPKAMKEEVTDHLLTLQGSPFLELYRRLKAEGYREMREVPLSGVVGSGYFQGRADLVMVGNEIYLFDYKYSKGGDDEQLRKKYSEQMERYAEVLERAHPSLVVHPFIVVIPGGRLLPAARKGGNLKKNIYRDNFN